MLRRTCARLESEMDSILRAVHAEIGWLNKDIKREFLNVRSELRIIRDRQKELGGKLMEIERLVRDINGKKWCIPSFDKADQTDRLRFSNHIPSDLRDFIRETIGKVSEETNYNQIYEKFLVVSKRSIRLARTNLEIFPDGSIHLVTIECKTQVNVFTGTIGEERYYIIVE